MKLGLKKLGIFAAVLMLILAVMTGCSDELTHRDTDYEAPDEEVVVNPIIFKELDDGTFGVMMRESEKSNYDLTGISIPADYYGVPVTHIFEDGFSHASNLEFVTLPGSIKSIGKNAFAGCTMLRSVSIPNSVVSVGENAFNNCTMLSRITLGNGLTALEAGVFGGCSALSELVLPDSVNTIHVTAINGCTKLKNLALGAGITTIEPTTLSTCIVLETISIGDAFAEFNFDLLASCKSLKTIKVGEEHPTYFNLDGILYNKADNSIAYIPFGLADKVTLHESVSEIGEAMFADRAALSELVIPDSVNLIHETAFSGCTGLKKVRFGNGLTIIDTDAFKDCTKLQAVEVDGTNPIYITKDGILYDKSTREILYIPVNLSGEVTILEGVTVIPENAFADRKALKKVNLANSVETIETGAFANCVALESFTIGTGVNTMNNVAKIFEGCTALKTIEVDAYNDKYAVQDGILYNKSLTEILFVPATLEGEVKIAASVTDIAAGAFNGCEKITAVEFETVTGWKKVVDDKLESVSFETAEDAAKLLLESDSQWVLSTDL